MTSRNVEDLYLLSPLQKSLLFYTIYAPRSAIFFEQFCSPPEAGLDEAAYLEAWRRVVARHAVLRTSFLWQGELEEPLQVVHRKVEVPLERRDWGGLTPEEQRRRLDAFLRQDRRRGFDLATAPLLRLALLRLGPETWVRVWSYHHLVLDGWSSALVLDEVMALYDALRRGREPSLPPPPRPFRDYVARLRKLDPEPARDHWLRTLRGFTSPTPVGADRPAGALPGQGEDQGEWRRLLPPAATAALLELARRLRVTPGTLVQGAWALVLARISGRREVVFGTVVSDRPPELPGAEAMVGLLINTLPLRVPLPPRRPLGRWLKDLAARQLAAQRHAHAPLERIRAWSEVPEGEDLFESIVVYESYPRSAEARRRPPELFQKTSYPLTVVVEPGGRLLARLAYDRRRFDATTAGRLAGYLGALLEALPRDPSRTLDRLSPLSPAQRHQLLVEDSATAPPMRAGAPLLHHPFERQARRRPDAPAVVAEHRHLSAGELERRSRHLASRLAALGVGPEVAVGLLLERSPEQLAAVLAVLRAGGCYLPMEISWPAELRSFLLDDAGARLVLTRRRWRRAVEGGAAALCLDEPRPPAPRAPISSPGPDNLAYLIYTSGSTGQPKGVAAPHRGAAHYALEAARAYELDAGDRVLQFAALSFDASVEEIFPTLAAGATLVPRNDDMLAAPGRFFDECDRRRVTVLNLPTAYWHQLAAAVERGEAAVPASVRLVILGGEQARGGALAAWYAGLARHPARRPPRLLNTYGPTEATVVTTRGDLPAAEPEPPIGRPVAGARVHLLGFDLSEPVPHGAAGQIAIAGAGLARGYLGRPALTAERFRPHPFGSSGDRLYLSGDLARRRGDGQLEFLGRLDGQVKLRGYRVEPGQVEAALAAHPAVGEAAVVARRLGEEDALAAYIAPPPGIEPPTAGELRRFLRERLPAFMVPALFEVLGSLPLTTAGKVHRRALAQRQVAPPRGEQPYAAPRTPTEEVLAALCAEILPVERVGIHDDFFELGGHSLHATRLAARARGAFAVDLPLQAVFQHPTVALLATFVEDRLIDQLLAEEDRDERREEVEQEGALA